MNRELCLFGVCYVSEPRAVFVTLVNRALCLLLVNRALSLFSVYYVSNPRAVCSLFATLVNRALCLLR